MTTHDVLAQIKAKKIEVLEWLIILGSACIPLFFTFPYRINLFLAWEGAYRVMEGQIPYRDFGMPVGYGFWILPAIFFKIFGPNVFTLIIVQAFINIISNFTLSKILRLFNLESGIRVIVLTIYALSYTMFNFWPWYNHLVFVFELISFFFILDAVLQPKSFYNYLKILAAAGFAALAFLTKQDTGGFAFIFGLCFLAFEIYRTKNYKLIAFYAASYVVVLAILIVPFLSYDFGYWFNYGQSPHFSRLTIFDLINEFLGASSWIKFYLLLVTLIIIYHLQHEGKAYLKSDKFYLSILTLFILAQAAVIQVTSYTPIDGNIYFHSFAIAFILIQVQPYLNFKHFPSLLIIVVFAGLWWSNVYWTRFFKGKIGGVLDKGNNKEVVSKNTYILHESDSGKMSRKAWRLSDIPTFKRIKLPDETIKGIKNIQAMPIVKEKGKKLRVLNMSELTQLAYILPYKTETGDKFPLWYHQGVAFFDREVELFCEKIHSSEYDLILFEDIPDLNNFYSYDVQNCIKDTYDIEFKFLAPRLPEFSYIEVYTRKNK